MLPGALLGSAERIGLAAILGLLVGLERFRAGKEAGLPAAPVDRWGWINLQRSWIMVVLISGIGFANYLLLRRYGARGVAYAGFLGGFVNSTATVVQLAASPRSRPRTEAEAWALPGILFSKTAMYLRNIIILGLFAPLAMPGALVPLGLMGGVSAALAFLRMRRLPASTPNLRLQSPFSLRAALEFGAVFLVLTIVAGEAHRVFGPAAFYGVAVVGGMVSSSTSIAAAAVLSV